MLARMLVCAAFAALLLATPAAAELSTLWRMCTGQPEVDWDQQIMSCTAIIEFKRGNPSKTRRRIQQSRQRLGRQRRPRPRHRRI